MNRRLTADPATRRHVKVSAPFVAVGIDVPGESYFGGVATALNVQNVFRALNEALCEQKARGQFGIVARSPHGYRKIAFSGPNLERFFDRKQILFIDESKAPEAANRAQSDVAAPRQTCSSSGSEGTISLSSDLTRKHRTLDRNHQ